MSRAIDRQLRVRASSHRAPLLPVDWHEQLVDGNGRLDQRLLGHVANERLERGAVGLDAVGAGITAEGRGDLVELRDRARQHGAQRADLAHLGKRTVLGLVHRLEKTGGDERMFLVDRATDGDEVHDREDARAAVIVEFDGMEVGKQSAARQDWCEARPAGRCRGSPGSPLSSSSPREWPEAFCSIDTGLISGGVDGLPCECGLLVAPCTQCTPDKSTPYSSCSKPRMKTAAVWV